MNETRGLILREAWKEKGKSDCHHPDLHKEYSFSGTVTGCYICATCGQLMRMEQVRAEVKNPRYDKRIQINSSVIFTIDSRGGEGRALDITVPGCLIESPISVEKGDYLQLKLLIPGLQSPLSVELAAVRWTNGSQFGVEFIKMHEKARRQLNQVIARHLSNQALMQEGKRHQASEPDEQNRYLDTYLLAEESKGAA